MSGGGLRKGSPRSCVRQESTESRSFLFPIKGSIVLLVYMSLWLL